MDYWNIILDIGSLGGILAFIYTASQIFRKRPRLKFQFKGQSGTAFKNNGKDFYRLNINGMLKNQSLEPSSVNTIHSVIWGNKKTFSTLRHSTAIKKIISKTDNGKELKLPFLLNPHEGKDLEIVLEFHVGEGSTDKNLLSQRKKIGEGLYLPKYDYNILFEDTNENIFDENGKLCNMEESGLRWTIGNTMHSFKDGKHGEFITHYFKILKSKFKFRLKKILLFIGIY